MRSLPGVGARRVPGAREPSECCDFENAQDHEGAGQRPNHDAPACRGRPAVENQQRCQHRRPAKVNDNGAGEPQSVAAVRALDEQGTGDADQQRTASAAARSRCRGAAVRGSAASSTARAPTAGRARVSEAFRSTGAAAREALLQGDKPFSAMALARASIAVVHGELGLHLGRQLLPPPQPENRPSSCSTLGGLGV